MSWENQGRQWHGWFGTGTGGGPDAGDAALGVVRDAVGLLPAARRGAFGRYLADGGAGELREAIPIWAGASGLEGRAFRRLVVGPLLGAEAAGSLRAMGAAFAAGDYGAAAARLADAVGSEPSGRWAGGLGWARDQAVYSGVNGRVPGEGRADAAGKHKDEGVVPGEVMAARYVVPVPLPVPGSIPDVFIPGSMDNRRFVEGMERSFRSLADAFWGIVHSSPDQQHQVTPPNISPSSGTGTPDPDNEPDNNEDAQSGKKDREISRMEKETGISRQEFRDLAGFTRRLDEAATASTEASPEIVARMKARGVPREMIQAYKEFYEQTVSDAAKRGGSNASATHRVARLESILRRY